MNRVFCFLACIEAWAGSAAGQANGNLQIHHIDVGQGDSAPGGTVVLFDVGEDLKKRDCTKPVSYWDQLGTGSFTNIAMATRKTLESNFPTMSNLLQKSLIAFHSADPFPVGSDMGSPQAFRVASDRRRPAKKLGSERSD